MNYLAHLALAQPTVASKVGNLLGDFMRGVDAAQLPEPVRLGLDNHRLVDRLTDQHPEVMASRRLFSPQRRRFAGVAMDVLFDHFLLRHWAHFHDEALAASVARDYQLLLQGRPLMPTPMREHVSRLVAHDGLRYYRSLEEVGQALDRMAARIRFANRFQGMADELAQHYDELEQVFLKLYPQLQREVAARALEYPKTSPA